MSSATSSDIELKEQALHDVLRGCGSAVIGFSGGVDSSYLAKAALDALGRDRVLAVTGRSPAYPAVQHEMALAVARSIGLPRLEIETHELDDPDYAANSENRCYFCKADLYQRLLQVAREKGFAVVLDGSNADDLGDYRPGLRAARELGVRSPLQEVGLTKAEIRALSRRAALPTWEIPASPCLASRIPYGLQVTPERLRQIEEAEAGLRALHAWRDLRVRHHGELGRLEVAAEDMDRMADPAFREAAVAALKEAGFTRACLDLQGYRRGALNELIGLGGAGL
ncbi:MAG: ATP-dependent sacrificial sulfur transferase LarE [Gemmatimonadota bacterium]